MIATVEHVHSRGWSGPLRGVRVERILPFRMRQAVNMKFDLQTAGHAQALRRKLVQGPPQLAPSVEFHGRAIAVARFALDPARARGPGQHLEGALDRLEQHIGRSGQSRLAGRKFGIKHREGGAIRAVLERKRADHAHTLAQRLYRSADAQRLGAGLPVQVAPGKAHLLEPQPLDLTSQRAHAETSAAIQGEPSRRSRTRPCHQFCQSCAGAMPSTVSGPMRWRASWVCAMPIGN